MSVPRLEAVSDFAQTPPHDDEAERCTLGGMLLSKDAIEDVAGVPLAPGHHYKPAHQIIHEAIQDLYERGDPVDPVAVGHLLAQRKQFVQTGGGVYLHTLIASVPTAANAGFHARIVREHADRREAIRAGTRIVQLAHEGDGTGAEILERARQMLDSATTLPGTAGPRSMDELMTAVLHRLESGISHGIPTGLRDLDDVIAGLGAGELILIAARPSVGKSILTLDMAANAAINMGIPVLLSSLEMSAEEITLRLISRQARVNLNSLVRGELTDRDWDLIAKAHGQIAKCPLVIDDDPECSLAHIRGRLRAMARTDAAQLLAVDYLGLLSGPQAENRQSEVAAFSRGLKLIAREFSIPVLAAAQLNRGPESRHDKRPQKSDLRDSGAQEQDADIIILLHREDEHERESPRAGEIDLIVDKNRQGPKSTVTAAFQGHYARVVDMAKDWSPSRHAVESGAA
jgi:replicative DNA helicase